ncbi:MAG: xanthine dehydrogenase family protein molybdopterin-binding subunit [Acidobacteriota bacterium]|nr:xanthine dehydrogenase family protein molybdopterin-binding subunit [Acidobacteriota bacterium]
MSAFDLSRRDLARAAGGGLFVYFHAELLRAQEPAQIPGRVALPSDFNAFLRIGEDGRVECLVGKVELGQGAMTSLAEVLAEELDAAYDTVDVVMGDTDRCPYDMGTFGSMTTPLLVPVVRRAGAEARAVLLAMAAERLSAPADRLRVKNGVVTDPARTGSSVAYAALVQGRRIERHLSNIPVKPVEQFQVIGHSPRRKDGLEKVTGKARYAGDQLPPGLLHARVLRPPAHRAKLLSVDTSEAAKMPGVRVIREGDLVAVLHARPDIAGAALGVIQATFSETPAQPDQKTIFDHLLKTAPEPRVVAQTGDLAQGERLAAALTEGTYLHGYGAHAPMETHSATALVENGKVTVWASTQAPFSVKNQVIRGAGFAPEQVRIISRYVGGGFGGKTGADQAVDAARLAKITGCPVQVVWNRADEFFHDPFRPAAVLKIRSGMTADGAITLWDAKIVGSGEREARPFYAIPHQRTLSAGGWQGGNPPGMHPFNVGPWRAPSVNSNTFGRESHIDVMAAKGGFDPLEFRLRNLSDERMKGVLQAAAERFAWRPEKAPGGRGAGVACGMYANSCNATMAEVAVNKDGHVQVKRVVIALDVGVVLNPEGMRQQAEGCVMMGIGYALSEEVRFEGGKVLNRNFDDYEIPRFSWLPRIEIVLVDNPRMNALGGGEPPIVAMGAALANAIFDATGKRLVELPMTPARVKAALA